MSKDKIKTLQTMDRAISVLEIVAAEGEMSLDEINKRTNINKTTLLRILDTWRVHRYIEKDSNGNYSSTLKLFELGTRILSQFDYLDMIRAELQNLSKEYDVIAQYSVEDDRELLYLESFDNGTSGDTLYSRIGTKTPLYATSAGKAIISTYNRKQIIDFWESIEPVQLTNNTITDVSTLLSEVNEIHKKGYAVDSEENIEGIYCVGAVIYNYKREPLGAISVSTDDFNEGTEQRLAEGVLKLSNKISRLLGYYI